VRVRYGIGLNVLKDCPGKAREFAGDGNGRDGGSSALLDPSEEFVEAMLSFPAMCDDVGRDSLLSLSKPGTDTRRMSVAPGGLNEDVTAMAVAGLGDGAAVLSGGRGVFAGHEADEGHEGSRTREAAKVTELGTKDHGAVSIDASKAAEPPDRLPVAGRERELLDLPVEVVATTSSLYSRRARYSLSTSRSSSTMRSSFRSERIQVRCFWVQLLPSRKTNPRRRRNLRM